MNKSISTVVTLLAAAVPGTLNALVPSGHDAVKRYYYYYYYYYSTITITITRTITILLGYYTFSFFYFYFYVFHTKARESLHSAKGGVMETGCSD